MGPMAGPWGRKNGPSLCQLLLLATSDITTNNRVMRKFAVL